MKPDCVMGLATGGSPEGIYKQLIDWYNKGDIIKQAFFGPVTPQVPASILQMHPDFTLIGDEEALSKI